MTDGPNRKPPDPKGNSPSNLEPCLWRLPLTAARCGKSNPKPGTSWKSVPSSNPNGLLLWRWITRTPLFRVRNVGAPMRAALGVPDCTRIVERAGAEAEDACEIAAPPRNGAAITGPAIPPRCCAAASAGIANTIIATAESLPMAEPLCIAATLCCSYYLYLSLY